MYSRKNFRGESMTIVLDHSRDNLLNAFSQATLKDRYLLKGETFQDAFARVAVHFASDQEHAQRMYDVISRHWFMPATPVLSNGGTKRGLPISCFLNNVPDTIEGIRDTWAENVNLASNGGGIGTCWSDVRSIEEEIGAGTEHVGTTSGVIPFIKVMDSLTLAISQGSLRRGSAAVYMDMEHPEIEEFLDIRRPKGDANRRCLNIHQGVTISDAFMHAVENDQDWALRSPKTGEARKTVKARDLWIKLLVTRLETGEPYIVWTDTVNRNAPAVYKALGLRVKQSNLCSEIALHTGIDHIGNDRTAVCCLGSLVEQTRDQWFGNRQFLKDVLLFLDNVLEDFISQASGIPGFEKAVYSAKRERSIGLGVMGFHSYLQTKGIIYESALAKSMNLKLWNWLAKTGAEINEEVAKEIGACPDAIDAGLNVRWSHMFSVAPTASISIIASCGSATSPGVEPWAANIFTQKTLSGSFEVRNPVLDELLDFYADAKLDIFPDTSPEQLEEMKRLFKEEAWEQVRNDDGSVRNLSFLTQDERDRFKTFEEIDQRWVISHAADRAPMIDQMASNNIFLSPDIHKRDLHQIHLKAWRDGVPSLYYCRSKSIQRATKASNIAGELPSATAPREVVLQDRGTAMELDSIEANKYETCLACQ